MLNHSMCSHFVFITLLPSENVSLFTYHLSSFGKEKLFESKDFVSFISNFHLAECLAYSNHLINVYLINQQSSK